MDMKTKILLPIIALCAGGLSSLSANDADLNRTTTYVATPSPFILSSAMNATVKDAQGDNLGQIKDVVIDPVTGRATFAVIQLNGDVGPRGAFAPVPWSLLSPAATTAEPKTFVLNVNRDQFASGQRYYLNHWPDTDQAVWGPKVYAYYGLNPNALGTAVGGAALPPQMEIGSDYYYRYGMGRYGPTRADGTPIDNGTAPDGKGTFVRGLHF